MDDPATGTIGEAKEVSLAKPRDSSSNAATGAIPIGRVADATNIVLIERNSDLAAGWIDNTFLHAARGGFPPPVGFEQSPSEAASPQRAAVAAPKMAPGINGFNIPAPRPTQGSRGDRAFKMPSQFSLNRPALKAKRFPARVWLGRSLLLLGTIGIAGVAALVLSPDTRRRRSAKSSKIPRTT